MREQILSFLAQGFSKATVLKTVGCSEDFYDELIKAEGFISDLAQKKEEIQETRIERKYNVVEEKILDKISSEVDLFDPAQLCRTLDTIARNKNAYKKPVNHFNHAAANLQITVNIPQPAVNQKVVLNSNNQVVAIGDRVMTALPLQGVKDLFAKLEKPKLEAIEELSVKELRHDLELPEASSA